MKLNLSTLFLLVSISISAQTYVSIPWRAGSIVKNGEVKQGAIRLGGDLGAPWLNHAKVYFVSAENYIAGKTPKKKFQEEYSPEDIEGYTTFTEEKDGKRIEMNFVTDEVMIEGTLKKKNAKAFLRINEQGAVNIYSYIPKPEKNYNPLASDRERELNNQYALDHSTYYLRKGDAELIPAAECVLIDYLKECPEVVEKIKNESYGFKPLAERKKRKGLGKLMAKSIGDNVLENKIYLAITDYNNCVDK
ncbi:MAG: hypothetical protein R2828_35245 [Saprospiraceae bacterium]